MYLHRRYLWIHHHTRLRLLLRLWHPLRRRINDDFRILPECIGTPSSSSSPSRPLYRTIGPPDPLQDLYPLQQHSGTIRRGDSDHGNFQNQGSGTFLLCYVRPMGVAQAYGRLLAPPLWIALVPRNQPFPRQFHTEYRAVHSSDATADHWYLGHTVAWTFVGILGIQGTWRTLANGTTHELFGRDPDPHDVTTYVSWGYWLMASSIYTGAVRSVFCIIPRQSLLLTKRNPALAGCVCVTHLKRCKTSDFIVLFILWKRPLTSSYLFAGGHRRPIELCPTKLSMVSLGYPGWSPGRTCGFDISFPKWQAAKPRTAQLHFHFMVVAIW